MASIAGKVAPRFMGEYNASTTYQFYDAVTHNNKLYFCKKSGIVGKAPGNATDDNWFLSIDGSFTDATKLGGETAAQWQTKIDNVQTTSGNTFNPQSKWYRIAERNGNTQINNNSCFIELKRNSSQSEVFLIRLEASNNKREFKLISGKSDNIRLMTKIRYTVDSSKSYIEVFCNMYNAASVYGFLVNVFDSMNSGGAWKTLPYVETEETVDGVTVLTTYDIPANASPVTDLDLVGLNAPRKMPSGTDLNTCLDTGLYYFDAFATSYVNVPNAEAHNGLMFVSLQNHPTPDNERLFQLYFSANQNTAYFRTCNGSVNGWKPWKTLATTADLANYMPLDGSKPIQRLLTIGSTDLAKYVALLLKNNMRSLEFGITEDGAIQLHDNTNSKNVFYSDKDGTNTWNGTASGNLPLAGGTIGDGTKIEALKIKGTTSVLLGMYNSSGSALGYFGINASNKPIYQGTDNVGIEIHHDGNSAKVAIQSSAPNDTTALWVDTANKKVKAYIDGAWTAMVA